MKKLYVLALAALLAAPTAFAGSMPKGMIAGYVTSVAFDQGGGVDDTGTGFGVKGWASVNGPFFVHGEYQTVSLDPPGPGKGDLQSLRLGGGIVGEINPQLMWLAKAEYLDFGSDVDQAGFGVHGGVMFHASDMLGFGGTLGYLTTDDTDGLEVNVGGHLAFTQQFAGILDLRNYMGSVDPSGDFDVFEIRVGVAYMF